MYLWAPAICAPLKPSSRPPPTTSHPFGIAPEKIHVTGIRIMPAFGLPPERPVWAAQFGLAPERTTFLLMGGGGGLGNLNMVAAHLLALDGHFQLIALAGKNGDRTTDDCRRAVTRPGGTQRRLPA